ncbi:hypothetical protein C8Q79DRAFT_1002797 [Trametes meyenii]|nr:hypothetical protein C8Q79DRAFT_1002797 [Trametes meyenii]
MPRLRCLLAYAFFASTLWTSVLGRSPGNTTCDSSQLDWYTSVVGETPCDTYQKLRQICNSDYRVPAFRDLTPGDNCDDQLSVCCCNSVSFALSMLCMNCQFDTAGGNIGIDAGSGAYRLYRGTCGDGTNHTLPNDIQTAVCNKEIKIDRNLYSLFWDTGACQYTKQTMTKDFAVTNNNTFTHCNSTLKGSTTPSPVVSATTTFPDSTNPPLPTGSSDSGTSHSNHTPVLVGAIVGAIAGAIIIVLSVLLCRKSRLGRGPKQLDLGKEYVGTSRPESEQMTNITPFSVAPSVASQSNSGYGGGMLHTPSEQFALLPRGVQSPPSSEKYGPTAWNSTNSFAHDAPEGAPERHEDAGPIPALQRSASGRLPPAYRHSWEADSPIHNVPGYSPPEEGGEVPPIPGPPGPGSSVGGSASGGGGESVVGEAWSPVSEARGRDVKRPLPEPGQS